MNKKPCQKFFFINISVSFLTVVICFLIIEVILRLFVYNFAAYRKSLGPNSTYKFETIEYKTIIKTNSLNMRDHEIGPKKINEFRILCLGDSFTFGIGVDIDDTYVKLMEKILNKNAARFNLINGGGNSAAWGCYEFLAEKGPALNPDLVIMQIYIGNDFYDDLSYVNSKFTNLGAELKTKSKRKAETLDIIKAKLFQKICMIDFIWNRLIQINYIDNLLFHFNLRYSNRGIYLRKFPEVEKKAIAATLKGLKRINTLCNGRGIKMILIIIPDKPQVFKKKFLNNDKYYYKKPNEILKTFCKNNNIPRIDFLDKYEELPEEEVRDFYYVKDIHWTAKGHKYAAEAIAAFIKK